MEIKKIIRCIYFLLLMLLIFTMLVVGVDNFVLFLGFLVVVLIYLAFDIGNRSIKIDKKIKIKQKRNKIFEKYYILFAILAIYCSLKASEFYTGQTLSDTLNNLKLGKSNYSSYQLNFIINKIGEFSLEKIIYIIYICYVKFIFLYGNIYVFNVKISDKKYKKYLFLFLLLIAHLYFGLARGTNFELFEVCLLYFYIYTRKINKFNYKRLLILSAAFYPIVNVFKKVIENRGHVITTNVTNEFYYLNNSFVSQNFLVLSKLIYILSAYFSFGTWVIGNIIINIFFQFKYSFILGVIPQIMGLDSLNIELSKYIDLGVTWVPDAAKILYYFGFTGLLIFCFILGVISKKINSQKKNNKILFEITSYLIVLELVSLPIGNFIMISTGNKIIVFVIILWWLKLLLIKKL